MLDDLTILVGGFILILAPLVIGGILAEIFDWE